MSVLIITALVTGIFGYIATQQYNKHMELLAKSRKSSLTTYYMFVIVCTLILAFVTGLRYRVGTDYYSYYTSFSVWAQSLSTRLQEWDEPGLALIANILYKFTDDSAYFLFTVGALTVFFFVITLSKNCDDFFFTIMLFMFTSWVGCFNGIRQYLAAAIIFAGHRLIYERKFIKYCIVVFLGASVHITGLIMLPMYFLVSRNLNFKKILFILASGVALVFSYDLLFEIMGVLKDTDSDIAGTTYAQNEIHPLRIVIALAPIIVYAFLAFQKKVFTREENFYMSALFVNFALIFATANSALLNRVTIYFKPFISVALCHLCNKFEGNQKRFMKALIIILYAIVWIYVDCMGVKWYWIFNR